MGLDKETATTLNRMQKQKTLRAIAQKPSLPLEENAVEEDTAKKFRLLEDQTLSLAFTGPVRLIAGQVIEDPRLLFELKKAGAKLRPIA